MKREEKYRYWEEVMKDYEISGLSQPQYCKAKELEFRKFKYYRYQISLRSKEKQIPKTSTPPDFTEITITPQREENTTSSSGKVTILFPTGVRCELMGEIAHDTLRDIKEVFQ